MRPCKPEDFGNTDVTNDYFYSWKGFTILCPETTNSDGKKLTLNGAWGFNQTSKIEFRVNRCQKEFHNCDSEENIDAMLRDMMIQTWIVHDHIDFRNYDSAPVSQQMQVVSQLSQPIRMPSVSDRTVYESTALMQKNTYDTYDSWFAIGTITQSNHFYTVGTKNSVQVLPDKYPERIYT